MKKTFGDYCDDCTRVNCGDCLVPSVDGKPLMPPSGYAESGSFIEKKPSSAVDHPSYYADGRRFEPIDVVQDWNLGFCLGNTVKYISRAGRKNPEKTIEDLEKAEFYLKYYINFLKSAQGQNLLMHLS